MAFNGYLIKIKGNDKYDDWEIPMRFMRAETYQVLMSGQDLDSYRDTNGDLHRTALDHYAPKVEFELPCMWNDEVDSFMNAIRNRYVNSKEKKVQATVYLPEKNKYVTHDFYVPDITFSIYRVDEENKKIQYNQTRVAFISYGGNV